VLASVQFRPRAAGNTCVLLIGAALSTVAGASIEVTRRSACVVLAVDPGTIDTDLDGCSDAEEMGDNPLLGGRRDPAFYWDFFDVTHDQRIDASDVLFVLGEFGDDGQSLETDLLDRKIGDNNEPWRSVAANNGIDLEDALASLAGFGHDCSG
jgi:hypothetical protein